MTTDGRGPAQPGAMIMKSRRGTKKATAYHEAGHIVAAIREGILIRSATVVPTKDAAGHVVCAYRPRRIFRALEGLEMMTPGIQVRVEREVRVLPAGLVAQRKFRSNSVRGHHPYNDHQLAISLLNDLAGSDREIEAYLKLLQVQAEQVIESRWWAVKAFAKALIERKTLMRDEIQEVHEAALRDLMAKPRKDDDGQPQA